jgi:hypothetical protein
VCKPSFVKAEREMEARADDGRTTEECRDLKALPELGNTPRRTEDETEALLLPWQNVILSLFPPQELSGRFNLGTFDALARDPSQELRVREAIGPGSTSNEELRSCVIVDARFSMAWFPAISATVHSAIWRTSFSIFLNPANAKILSVSPKFSLVDWMTSECRTLLFGVESLIEFLVDFRVFCTILIWADGELGTAFSICCTFPSITGMCPFSVPYG